MEMTYKEFIDNILETRGRFNCGEEYHERHHIVPRCMGGTNDKENLIDLFAREHFDAHRLLALENPENDSLTYAWWMMAHTNNANQRDYEITAEEYEEARIVTSIKQKEAQTRRMESNEARDRIRNSLLGRYTGDKNPHYGKHCSEETKEKISKANKGRFAGENNYFYGKHFSKEQHPMYGHKHSKESREKISMVLKGKFAGDKNPNYGKTGKLSPNYGKTHSEETKRKMSEAHRGHRVTEDTKEKIRKKAIGRSHSEDTKRKMRKDRQGEKNSNAKIICQFDLNMKLINVWKYVGQASQSLNINRTAISMVCVGTHKTAGGFIWKYLYDQTHKDGAIIPGAITLGLISEEEALKQLKSQKDTEGEN